MEVLFEGVLQFVGEILLQLVFQVLAELGVRSLRSPLGQVVSPWLSALAYALLGGLAMAVVRFQLGD